MPFMAGLKPCPDETRFPSVYIRGFLRIDGVGRRCYDGGLFAGCRKPPVSVMLSEAKHPIPLNREKDSKG
jgi:hypothetical protein